MSKLPPLPPFLCHAGDSDCHTPEQTLEYGQQCRDAALDEAAKVCDKFNFGQAPAMIKNAIKDMK